MRFHDALLYRRRLAEYYANCSPTFPLLPLQLRRPIQSYDPKLFSPPVRPGSSPIEDANSAAGLPTVGVSGSNTASQSSTTLLSRAGDQVGTEQPISPPSMPLFGALFSYLHPSLTAAAAAAMAHWYLGAGAGAAAASRPQPTADPPPLLAQRGGAGQIPDWVVRLRVEDLLRARSAAAAAAAMTGQASSSVTSGQYVGVDDGPWVRHAATRVTEGVQSQQPAQQSVAGPDTAVSSDVTFRPYLPDVRRPMLPADQRRSPDVEPAVIAAHWDRSDADGVSSGSKTPDHEAGSGDSVGGSGVEANDGRNSSELINMERMVHGLKHVQTAAIEELSKVADSY